jgi:hypothetical protein
MENHFNENKCTNPNVSESFLNKKLRNESYTILLADSFVAAQKFLVELYADLSKAIDDESTNEQLAQLEAQHEIYKEQLAKAIEMYVYGKATKESVDGIIKPITEKDNKVTAKIDELIKPRGEKLRDLESVRLTMDDLRKRLSEIFDVDNYNDLLEAYSPDYAKPPKKEFTKDEILKDVDRIMVTADKNLVIKFRTLAEIEKLVKRHEHIMTDRTVAMFEELKATELDGKSIYLTGRETEVETAAYLREMALIDKALKG